MEIKNNNYSKNKHCLDCNIRITNKAIRCKSCTSKGNTINLGRKLDDNHKRKISKILKRLFKEGKLKINSWNKGLTKETDIRVIKNGKNISTSLKNKKKSKKHRIILSKVRKKLLKEGKIKSWNKGLTKEDNEIVRKISEKLIGHTVSKKTRELIKERRKKQVLPLEDTSIELKIQDYLKQLKVNFFTHKYIKDIEHGYQCDIWIPSIELIIECDGDYWHKYPKGTDIDHIRTKELIEKGFKVLRLWEHEINTMTLNTFKEKIKIS